MRYIALLNVIILWVLLIFTFNALIVSKVETHTWRAGYKAVRAAEEGFRRTIGRPVNPAYVCKERLQ